MNATPTQYWDQLQARDQTADGVFYFAVKTTGIYCRPSCKSRTPKRENVQFFLLPAEAEAAGYRACKRCRPQEAKVQNPQAQIVQQACDYINAHLADSDALTLDAIGAGIGYDGKYIQHVFKAMLQITPRQYAEARRLEGFKQSLRDGANVTDSVFSAGFGSMSRVYEKSDAALGMTPATYRAGGAGVTIHYTLHPCDLGVLLVGMTERGVCAVGLYDSAHAAEIALGEEYPLATTVTAGDELQPIVARILDHIGGVGNLLDLPLDIRATAFQRQVWEALRKIPRGETRSYSDIAEAIGNPNAVRAVASACANNVAAIVIPCHRVVGKDGAMHGYRWGTERKAEILRREQE
ncbi:MAG: bifunctional DNA-binding transcriptional regulator/O6-methylguanine-DNA methyltransferase Ada [Phototrophicaceae bacterium]